MDRKTRKKIGNRIISVVLALVLCITCISTNAKAKEVASDAVTQVVDNSTLNAWKDVFSSQNINTEYVGTVWTDKTVVTNANAFASTGITKDKENSFLVALSAMGSTMNVTGMTNVPIDTVLILDISGSMNDDNNDVVEELVEAANASIADLLKLNNNNRISVILYSGKTASTPTNDYNVVLPLNRYSTADDNQYLTYVSEKSGRTTTEYIGIDADVKIYGTNQKPSESKIQVYGATYIQKGMKGALEQLLADSNTTTVDGVKRTPVVVLMSDGAPTLSTTSFTDPGNANMGDGTANSSTAAAGFVTQLTLAYAKTQIEQKYQIKPYFYTVGIGVSDNSVATSVLNPANSSNAIKDFWSTYNKTKVNGTITVSGNGNNAKKVTKISTTLNQNYVNKYFEASGNSGNLANELKEAFADVVGTISLQSRYYPTLIAENDDISGFVSFVDKVGEYMEVTDMKGILIGDTLFSGADLSSNFVSGGGRLGTFDDPSLLGLEFVSAVQTRFGIDADQARTIIGLAYEAGQLSYTNSKNFSNYIGWYANAEGEFLGFYDEGNTVLPEATGNADTDAAFTIKSYGYLGEVDLDHGVAESDMMYAIVQVRTNIVTGEETVVFAVPAALIPIVSYNVSVDENGELEELTLTGATSPIRLVYEVALKDEINEFNMKEMVSEEYLNNNTNPDGSVNFYTNMYEVDGSVGYNKVNTYSYFNPSRQNDHYYYKEDEILYSDTNGTIYNGKTQPTTGMYRSHTVYKNINGNLSVYTGYHAVADEVLSAAVYDSVNGYWYVPKGIPHVNHEDCVEVKTANKTGTLGYVDAPVVDISNHSVDEYGYDYIVASTLGNNGKLTVTPETGLKITKTMAEGSSVPGEAFTFVLTNISNNNDNRTYDAVIVRANGAEMVTTVKFTAGAATVSLGAGEAIYVGGMTAGNIIAIREISTPDYILASINGDSSLEYATIAIAANQVKEANFVNEDRGKGNLVIGKEVEHELGSNYNIPSDKVFTIRVTLSGIGTANATFNAKQTNSNIQTVTTDGNGQILVTLRHMEQFEIYDLPAGTVAVVEELNPGLGFTPSYAPQQTVTVPNNKTASVLVENVYNPESVNANIDLTVSKNFVDANGNQITDWAGNTFTVVIQRFGTNGWETIKEEILTSTNPSFQFDLSAEEYTSPGTYSYQVFEIEPSVKPDGLFYDTVKHTFSVIVTDTDMDGQLEIAGVHSEHAELDFPMVDGRWQITNSFTNVQYPTAPAVSVIDVQKLLVNESGSPLVGYAGYHFNIYVDENCTTPVTNAIAGVQEVILEATDAVGEGTVQIIFDKIGEYTFYLKEVATGINNMDDSDEVVKVTFDVTNSATGSRLEVETTYDKATNSDGELEFTNIYDPTDAIFEFDFVYKELANKALTGGEFTFEVQTPEGDTLLVGTNDADGKVFFDGVMKYAQVGHHTYKVVETSVDGKGVTVDKNVYEVHVVVVDNNGELEATHSVVDEVGDDIIFRNVYTTAPVTNALGGNKTLNGRVLLNDEFTFVIFNAENAEGEVLAGAPYVTTKNFADGTFLFPEVTYTSVGTYYYVIAEEGPTGLNFGIHYDTTKFVATVVIKDDGEGALYVAGITYRVLGGEEVAQMEFVNNYVANSTDKEIPGTKVLTGKVLSADDFSFALYESDENWVQGTRKEIVENAEDGTFAFAPITFEAAGSYYYLVKEVNGGTVINGITYDDSVYRVRIDVTDDLKGQLHAEVHVYDSNNIPQENVLFTNAYNIIGTETVTLVGTKDLVNGYAGDYRFTFELYETDADYDITGITPTTTNNIGVNIEFNLTYDAEDVGNTYYYVVKEANAGEVINHIRYGNEEYYITVVVEDDTQGGIKTTTTIKKDDLDVSTLDFTNEMLGDLIISKDVVYFVDGTEVETSLDGREDTVYNFVVYFSEDSVPTASFTLKDGEVKVIKDIPYGVGYTVHEVTTGAVFTSLLPEEYGNIEGPENVVAVVNRYDYVTELGNGLNFIKVDADTEEPLKGAEFGLYSDSECTNLIATAVSNEAGEVHFDITEAGTYYVKETKAPNGYFKAETVYTVTATIQYVEVGTRSDAPYIEKQLLVRVVDLAFEEVDDVNNIYTVTNNVLVTVNNPGSFVVYKVDADTQNPLAGAVFVLYDADGNVVARATTDAHGMAEFGPFTTAATYTLKEEVAPTNYDKTANEWTVKVSLKDGDPTIHIKDGVYNNIFNWIVNVLFNNSGSNWTNGVLTVENTRSLGALEISKDVVYFVDGTEVETSLDGREDVSYNFLVSFDDADMEDVSFTLKDGEVKVIDNIPYGTKYTVTEITTGAVYTAAVTNGTGTIAAPKTEVDVVNRYDYVTEFENGVTFIKVDAETAEVLAGAEFGLFSDAECTDLIATAVSNEVGEVYFDITAAGTYYVKETKAPEGYQITDTIYTVEATIQYVEVTSDTDAPYIKAHLVIGEGDYTVTNNKIEEEPEIPETPEIPEIPEIPDTPDTPDEPEVPVIPEIPNKGDNMLPVFYGLVLLLAGFGVVFTAIKLRKREEE